ncbi:MAG TPA: peptidoglycan -binding protein [Xanthobacteraceae bacterium]|jgi:chemotaxis protein MotB|nr:peptidoglycan -binding protein [Xanthobacteraceae bacterium]
MALARMRRGESGMNYWPGFVDALSTLILSIIFLLSVFVVVQFYLQQEVQGKDTALQHLNGQIALLSKLLSMEKTSKADLEKQLGGLQASLATTQSDRDKLKGLYEGAAAAQVTAESKLNEVTGQLESEKENSSKVLGQINLLNQQIAALRDQLAALGAALDVSEKKNKNAETRISELGQRLNVALAQHVQELSSYRSDFFGKLREVLGNRPDIRIVGDRFVLQSEIFFDTGRADLKPEGRAELDQVAAAIVELESQIPAEIAWILRVDGHTDVRPIIGQFKSNWDLSAERAISVVQYLVGKGVKPSRLVAAGFGEFQPIDSGTTEDAYRRNRRIEFKLTER